jgi:hypothetical protein
MGFSQTDGRYKINGLLATEATVMQNMEKICNACGTWLTYDIQAGKWSLVINRAGDSIYSFDNSNIVGPLTISSTGIYNLYNSVKVSYPRQDIRDQRDFVQITIPSGDLYPNEPVNVLELNYNIINDPIHATLLGLIELKQNRVDRVVKFQTDYSKIQVKAGDIIDITNEVYQFVNKKFRVVSVRESDSDAIMVEITALEYDADVYDESDLNRYTRSDQNGIVSIGALQPPSIPSITKYELDSRPRIVANTQIVGGVVEAVEFWYSTDAALPETSRNYNLLTTQRPKNGSAFAINDPIIAEYDGLDAGNIVVKVRSINNQSTSQFSTPTAVLYSPVQTTNNISNTTGVTDAGGNSITNLNATTLFTKVDGLFDSNANVSQSSTGIFGQFLNVFQSNTAVDLRTTAGKTNIDTVYLAATISAFESTFNSKTGGNVSYGNTYPYTGSANSTDGIYASFDIPAYTYTQYQIFVNPPVCDWLVQSERANSAVKTTSLTSIVPIIMDTYYSSDGITYQYTGLTYGGRDSQLLNLTLPGIVSYNGKSWVQAGRYRITINPVSIDEITHEGASPSLWPYYFNNTRTQPYLALVNSALIIQGYGWK